MSKPVLSYFPIPGRAEFIRMTFFIGSVDFVDEHVSFDTNLNDPKRFPNGSLPVLNVSGRLITQSVAIGLYAGHQAKLIPADPVEQAAMLEFMVSIEEIFGGSWGTNLIAALFCPPEVKNENCKKFEETLKSWLCRLDAIIAESGHGFAVGNSMTVADLQLYCLLGPLLAGAYEGISKDCIAEFTNVMKLVENVGKHPKVQEWNSRSKA